MSLKSRQAFGGTDPAELAALVRNGYATWIDTDESDGTPVAAHGAVLARAPIDTVFELVADFEGAHKFIRASRRNKILSRTGNEIVVRLRQGIGLGILSIGLEEVFRLRLHPPTAITCEEYIKGSFTRATYEVLLHRVGPSETLIVLSFLSDLGSLGRLAKLFFRHQPEVEFAASANILLVPLLAFVSEAERRIGRETSRVEESVPLWEAVREGQIAPALRHGYVTAGRFNRGGEIHDVTCATRLGASRSDVWKVVADTGQLRDILPVVVGGQLLNQRDNQLESELTCRVKIGPFTKHYTFRRQARFQKPDWIKATVASMNGHPVTQADYLFDDGPNTTVCHMYFTDMKTDWLSRIFLKSHPEFECVISAYPPTIVVRGFRLRFGAPRVG
ncbi:hypothetical protein ACFL59_00015 [Planctomycetota bacterium]